MNIVTFLLSYWWILFLIIIVTAVITRNLVKLALIVLGLLLILFVIFKVADILLGPAVKKIADCYTVANQNQIQMGIRIKQEHWDKHKFCIEDKNDLDNLTLCYKRAVIRSPISSGSIENLMQLVNPGQNQHLTNFIKQHNTDCASFPETLIQ